MLTANIIPLDETANSTMAFDPNSQDKLTQYFLEEVTELLETIEQNLYNLLEEKTTDKVHTLMRSAHTIKGSAANMELKTIETIAHHLEDVFESLYAEDLEIDPQLGSLLLEGYDCLKTPLTALVSSTDYDETEILDQTATVFAKLQEKLGDFFGREVPIPSSEELGFDVVGSIFTDSISQDLQGLEEIIAGGDTAQIASKTRDIAEFLQDLGLSCNLPGLIAIAESTLLALEKNPDDILSVAIAALENFYQSQANIVEGDRNSGGEVSSQLRQLAGVEDTQEAKVSTVPSDNLVTEISQHSAIAEQAISASAAMVESISETPPSERSQTKNDIIESEITPPCNDRTSSKGWSNSDLPKQENSEEESDSQLCATLFANKSQIQTKVPEILEPTQVSSHISPIDRILQSIWIAKPEQTIEFTPTVTKSDAIKHSESNNTIRVAVEQLDNLSHAMGELLIDDNLQTLQTEQFHNSIRQSLQQYRLCQQQLNEIYDWWDKQFERSRHRKRRMSRKAYTSSISQISDTNSKSQNFDPLEMDVYSDLHILLQSFNEKISQLGDQIENIEKFASESRFNTVKRKQALSQAQDNLLQARMVSLGVVLERFPRMLKQMVASHKKPAKLELKGAEIFIDKAISDKLYEPLLHLVRNAYDHGLEDSDIRREQNKPEIGTISIRAYNQGNLTFIELEDDGRGLSWQRIREKAIEKGILSVLDAERASDARLAQILFQSGFSTAESISDLSGRGVGLDVVRNQIENLGGRISLHSEVGKGTKFILQLPLNLTTSRLLICQSQDIVYGILSDTVIKIIVPQSDQITTQPSAIGQGFQTFLRWQTEEHKTLIPIVDLGDCITYQYPLQKRKTNSALKTFPIANAYRVPPLLLLENQGESFCLRVDEIIVEQELIIKSLGTITDLPDYLQGYTVLGDGSFSLVIEPDKLFSRNWQQSARSNPHREIITNALPPSSDASQDPSFLDSNTINSDRAYKVMVVEDSVVQRQSLVMTLEKYNYQVIEAANGEEALAQWQQNNDIRLIICDVEMPKINGFEFLNRRKNDTSLLQIPVIMLTTRSSQKHRQIAFSLGANQYHTKPYSDAELLATIAQTIERSDSFVAEP